MTDLAAPRHKQLAGELRANLAVYARAEDMINIGAYSQGSNPEIDRAIKLIGPIRDYLKQAVEAPASLNDSVAAMEKIFGPAKR